MRRSWPLLTLAAAIAQGAAFAAVGHLLANRKQRSSRDDGASRLDAVERRLAAIEALIARPPSFDATAGAPAVEVEDDRSPLTALFSRQPAGIEQPGEFPRVRPAASYLDEGSVYFEVGNYERAIDRFGRAIELQPDLAPAYFNRALALSRLGRLEHALSDYDRAAALSPRDADIYNNRGLLRFERDELQAALADFEQAIALEPNDEDAHANLALVRARVTAC